MKSQVVKVLGPVRTCFFLSALVFVSHVATAAAQTDSGVAQATERDGQHDFDFAIGSWKIHLKKLQHQLAGSTTWLEFDGTLATKKVWDGHANVEEFNVAGPTGTYAGLAIRLYNPQTHQWSIYWANRKNGTMDPSPQVGQ